MSFTYNYNRWVDDMPQEMWWLAAALSILGIIAYWKVFVKAGQPGWKSLIPIYNIYILYKIAWGSGWKFLWMLVPLVNIVVTVIMSLKLARAFGKGTGFGVGLVLLQSIFMMILAFGDAQYTGPQ